MVAHLGVIAMPLSHNFPTLFYSCTNGGETRPESYQSHWQSPQFGEKSALLLDRKLALLAARQDDFLRDHAGTT
jgi:hypothetical protein